uniref:SAC3_GANP domain-containing protein n=1 Tax=Panagrellus redivivus TaxID=6233 RepID=A0A7E4VX12_PANRE
MSSSGPRRSVFFGKQSGSSKDSKSLFSKSRKSTTVAAASARLAERNPSSYPGLTRNARNPGGKSSRMAIPRDDGDGGDDVVERAPKIGQLRAIFQENLKEGLKKTRRRTIDNEEGVAEMSKGAVAAQLSRLINKKCPDFADKYRILHERDLLLNQARIKNYNVNAKNTVIGTLTEMCPEKERYSRLMQRTVNFYEHDNDGTFNPDKAVKDYSRSAADQDLPLPHEMRPIATLQLTMDYLISNVVRDVPENASDIVRWYEFLWTRTRAIRKDLTQQQLVDEQVVDLIEKCVRFHIYAGYQLSPLDATSFDQRMNIENLNKCLQSLRHCFDDLAHKNICTPNEAEFRAYDILLNLTDSNVFNQASKLRPEVINDPLVKNALDITLAVHNENFARFFLLVAHTDTPFLQACLCHAHFNSFREKMLLAAGGANFGSKSVILGTLTPYFAFTDEQECLKFLTDHKCVVKESRAERTIVDLGPASGIPESDMASAHTVIVNSKLKSTVAELIKHGPVTYVAPPKATNSFDDQDRYTGDPVLETFFAEVNAENGYEQPPRPARETRPATDFSFGQSVSKPPFGGASNVFGNKTLFKPGYGEDPNEPVATKLFVPSKKQSAFGGAIGSFDAEKTAERPPLPPGFPSFKPQDVPSTAAAKMASNLLAPPAIAPVANASLPKPVAFAPVQPPKPPSPPPGPSQAELEAIAKKKADEERRQRELEAEKRKQLKNVVAGRLADQLFASAVEKVLNKSLESAVKFSRDEKKRRLRLARRAAHDIVTLIIDARVTALAEDACVHARRRWRRIQVIADNLRRIRSNQRATECIKLWRWFARHQREIRAMRTFKDAFKNPRYDGIVGAAKHANRSYAPRVSDVDITKMKFLTVARWRAERLGRSCIKQWREFVARKKLQRYEEIRAQAERDANANITLPTNMMQKRNELHRPLVPLFNRKRPSYPTSPISSHSKRSFRMMTSTPLLSHEYLNSSLPAFDVSPVINVRYGSSATTDIGSRATSRTGSESENMRLSELKSAVDGISVALREAKEKSDDFLRRYSHYLP